MSAREVTLQALHPHAYQVKLNDSAGHGCLCEIADGAGRPGSSEPAVSRTHPRRTGAPQRGQGPPSRPYTASDRPKYPLSPFTLTYRLSNEVPPASSASHRTSRTAASTPAASARRRLEVPLAQCVLARHSASSA